MVANALVGAALAAVVLSLVDEGKSLKKSAKQRVLWQSIWRGVKLRHLLPAPLVLALTGGVAFALHTYVGGVMNWGWWAAVGGQGNVILGHNEELFGAGGSLWIGRVMLLLVAVLMPNLVTWEERLFRRGIERRTQWGRVAWAGAFGLFHLVAGLPLFAALSLSILGLYCSWRYMHTYQTLLPVRGQAVAKHQAILESTRAHLGFNCLGVLIAGLTVVG